MKLVHPEVLASPISSSRLIGYLSMSRSLASSGVCLSLLLLVMVVSRCCSPPCSIRTLSKPFVALCRLGQSEKSMLPVFGRPYEGPSRHALLTRFLGQSWTPREFFSTEPAQFRTAIREKSGAFAGLLSRNHTLARHRPSRGPAAKITRALHKAIRITPPPNSRTLYRHR
jgi:hypothetical protein